MKINFRDSKLSGKVKFELEFKYTELEKALSPIFMYHDFAQLAVSNRLDSDALRFLTRLVESIEQQQLTKEQQNDN